MVVALQLDFARECRVGDHSSGSWDCLKVCRRHPRTSSNRFCRGLLASLVNHNLWDKRSLATCKACRTACNVTSSAACKTLNCNRGSNHKVNKGKCLHSISELVV
jgi:hypothetical protein